MEAPIKMSPNEVMEMTREPATNVVNTAEGIINDTGDLGDSLKHKISSTGEDLKEKITGAGDDLKEKITGAGDDLKEKITGAGDDLKEKITDAGDDLKDTITGAGDDVSKCASCYECCTGCAMSVLSVPLMVIGMVVNCLLIPVNAAIDCCCPSQPPLSFPVLDKSK